MALRSICRKCHSQWHLLRHISIFNDVSVPSCSSSGSSVFLGNKRPPLRCAANFSTISFDDGTNVVNLRTHPSSEQSSQVNSEQGTPTQDFDQIITDRTQAQLYQKQNQYQREIQQWMNSNPKIAPYKAEEKLSHIWVEQQELMSQFAKQQNADSLQPLILLTVDTVNLVIQAWCNSNNGEIGAKRAERLLRWMEDLHLPAESSTGLEPRSADAYESFLPMPNYQSYATVIDAWSRAAVYESSHAKPGTATETGKAGKAKRDVPEATKIGFECARRAEDVLMHMQEMHERRLDDDQSESYASDIQPDTNTFHLVLNAWSNIRGGTKASAMRATRILDLMQELHHYQSMNAETWQGMPVFKVQPNLQTYKHLIYAWASTNTPEGADQAEEILRHLLSISNIQSVETNPDEECFHIVMKAHAESVRKRRRSTPVGHASSADRARQVISLLDWMELLASRRAFKIQPTQETYRIAISAWAWSHDVDAPKEAENILFRMIRASEVEKILEGGKQNKVGSKPIAGPETRDFNTVINCCAFSRGIVMDVAQELEDDGALAEYQEARKEIFVIAEGVFDALLQSDQKPNSDTFRGMMRACMSLLPNNEYRDARIIELFRLAYKTPPPEEPSFKPKTTFSERLQAPNGGGCVDANVLRQLRLALSSTEEYIRVREEFEEYRRQNRAHSLIKDT